MIYVFHGSDRVKSQSKFVKVINAFRTKHPTGDIFRLEPDNFSLSRFEELVAGRGLFGQKFLIATDSLFSVAAIRDELLGLLPAAAESANTFLFLEEDLLVATVGAFKKAGAKLEESKKVVEKGPSFNIFSLTDALGARDRAKLWTLYQEALWAHLAPEEIFWKLVWAVNNLLLVKVSRAPITSLKPFVLQKATSQARNFTAAELKQLSAHLVALWHDSKSEVGREFEVGLERLVLSI